MISRYLQELKQRGGLTNSQIADRSGIPENTISNIISGKTVNPGFQVMVSIVRAMGGSLDRMVGLPDGDSAPANEPAPPGMDPPHVELVQALTSEVLAREDAIRAEARQRERDFIAKYEQREAALRAEFAAREEKTSQESRRRERWLFYLVCALVIFIMGVLTIDLLNPSFGYFRYSASLVPGMDGARDSIQKFCGGRLPHV